MGVSTDRWSKRERERAKEKGRRVAEWREGVYGWGSVDLDALSFCFGWVDERGDGRGGRKEEERLCTCVRAKREEIQGRRPVDLGGNGRRSKAGGRTGEDGRGKRRRRGLVCTFCMSSREVPQVGHEHGPAHGHGHGHGRGRQGNLDLA